MNACTHIQMYTSKPAIQVACGVPSVVYTHIYIRVYTCAHIYICIYSYTYMIHIACGIPSHVYTHIHIRMYSYVDMHVYTCFIYIIQVACGIPPHVYTHIHIRIYTSADIHVYTCVYTYHTGRLRHSLPRTYTYTYTRIHLCAYIYTYTYMNISCRSPAAFPPWNGQAAEHASMLGMKLMASPCSRLLIGIICHIFI